MTTQLHVTALGLPGVLLLKSIVHADVRGSFTQSWQEDDWRSAGVDIAFMQDNLVRGALLDVVADVRPESSLFGRWISVELKAGEGESLYVPAGYAHGYVTTEDDTIVLYKVDKPWVPGSEASCRWNDPTLNINWRCENPILSEKDAAAPFLLP